jgi:hypothetical protein
MKQHASCAVVRRIVDKMAGDASHMVRNNAVALLDIPHMGAGRFT